MQASTQLTATPLTENVRDASEVPLWKLGMVERLLAHGHLLLKCNLQLPLESQSCLAGKQFLRALSAELRVC